MSENKMNVIQILLSKYKQGTADALDSVIKGFMKGKYELGVKEVTVDCVLNVLAEAKLYFAQSIQRKIDDAANIPES